jgi:hypothetical protein
MSLFVLDGPLRLLPLFTAVSTAGFASTASRRERPFITAMGIVAVLVPLLGSFWGLLPESFRYVPEGLLLIPMEEVFEPIRSTVILATAYGGAIIAASLVVGTVRDTVSQLSRRNALQTWTLRQMLPPEASAAPAQGR